MNTRSIKKFSTLFISCLLLLSLAAQCGGAATPQIVEKVVTKEVEKVVTKEVEKVVTKEVEKVVTKEVEKMVTAEASAGAASSAERAVQEAKKYAGATINVVWESGLQPQDPLTFAPKWEELTGVKVNIVEMAYTDLYS